METNKKVTLRPLVLGLTLVLFVIMLALVLYNAEEFYRILNVTVMGTLMTNVGWATSLVMFFMVGICILAVVTPFGNIRFGGPNAKPKFTMMQFFGISLCTGIGAGVVFWGSAEPLMFAMEPPAALGLVPGSIEAVKFSMVHCFLQWGFTPYSSCVVMGIILSYTIINMGAPFKASSLLVPMYGKDAARGRISDAFDALTTFALTAAVAGGLGYGAMQLSAGIKAYTGIQPSNMMYIIIIVLMFLAYNASAMSGLQSGITWLSNKNAQFFFILLLFVLITGPTGYIFNLLTESFGDYLDQFFSASLFTAPYPNTDFWPQNWDMYWWVDWMAYAPLLGLFMVRVAYGRTVREFVLIEWIFPALFGIVWFAVFGGTILNAQLFQGIDYYSIFLEEGAEALTLATFDILPLANIAKGFMLLIITISLVTQCDSMAVTLSSMSIEESDENTEAPIPLKIFWGVVFAVVAMVFTVLGGIDGVKTIKSFAGIPLTFVVFYITIGFLKYMAKRPKDASGNYLYEDEVANAPDNGEPHAPRSNNKFLRKLGW